MQKKMHDNNKSSAPWYSSVLQWKFENIRMGQNGASWVKVIVTIGDQKGYLALAAEAETHFGTISPNNEEELTKLNESRAQNKLEKRTFAPTLSIRMFAYNIPVKEDGITPKEKPNEQYASLLFKAVKLYHDALGEELDRLMESKIIRTSDQHRQILLSTKKTEGKPTCDPDPIVVPSTSHKMPIQFFISAKSQKKCK